MPENVIFDLAKLDTCCGVRPGMTRAEVSEILKRQNVEVEDDDAHTLLASDDEWELEFHFTTDGTRRLRQVTIDIGEILWNGQALSGIRVDDAWRLMGAPATVMWEEGDGISDSVSEPEEDAGPPPTDEELLTEGTLWLPERGLGLVIGDGEVMGAVWRDTRDLPKKFAGPLTEAQRELSKKPDLDGYLMEKRLAQSRIEEKKNPATLLRKIATFAAIVALVWVGKKGFEEMRTWNQAPTFQAKFVEIEHVPMKQFRDFLPPALRWLFPRTKPVIVEAYRVEFTPPGEESPRQAVLERGELYVPPEKVGDEVPVAYVAGPPPRTLGLSRARDYAFIQYMPSAMAIGVLWLLVQLGAGLVPVVLRMVPRLVKRLAPSGVVKDPNRPELR